MSRSNHYRICEDCSVARICERHQSWSRRAYYKHKPERFIAGRRPWVRRSRFRFSPKSHHDGPSRWWWQEQHAKARQFYRREMQRSDDPVMPREQDLIDLWGWY